jgi:hypothetical protein
MNPHLFLQSQLPYSFAINKLLVHKQICEATASRKKYIAERFSFCEGLDAQSSFQLTGLVYQIE